MSVNIPLLYILGLLNGSYKKLTSEKNPAPSWCKKQGIQGTIPPNTQAIMQLWSQLRSALRRPMSKLFDEYIKFCPCSKIPSALCKFLRILQLTLYVKKGKNISPSRLTFSENPQKISAATTLSVNKKAFVHRIRPTQIMPWKSRATPTQVYSPLDVRQTKVRSALKTLLFFLQQLSIKKHTGMYTKIICKKRPTDLKTTA